jgi:hypothetical protein
MPGTVPLVVLRPAQLLLPVVLQSGGLSPVLFSDQLSRLLSAFCDDGKPFQKVFDGGKISLIVLATSMWKRFHFALARLSAKEFSWFRTHCTPGS